MADNGHRAVVLIPRKLLDLYVRAVTEGRTGNLTVHLRDGCPMALRFEAVEALSDLDRRESVAV